jgi:sugar/nucleoside kinase (ribokinase family)
MDGIETSGLGGGSDSGSGDAFAGGWLYGQLSGRGPLECARVANDLAGRIVRVYGCDYEAVGPLPG